MGDCLGIALVGLGKHAIRTVVPALDRCAHTSLRRVVVRDAGAARVGHPELADRITDDFSAALADPHIDGIYVATPLGTHRRYAAAALAARKHLWCEKPVVPSLSEAQFLIREAERAGLAMFEIDYYTYHRQFLELKRNISNRILFGEYIVSAAAVFTIPELAADDIRYRSDLDGGALFDVGYYPLSGALALFGNPRRTTATSRFDEARGVDVAGSALLEYDGFAVNAQWAIGASYRSEIDVMMSGSRLVAQRAFVKPADFMASILTFNAFGSPGEAIETGAHDAFVAMLDAQCAAVVNRDNAALAATYDAIRTRATLIERIRHAVAV